MNGKPVKSVDPEFTDCINHITLPYGSLYVLALGQAGFVLRFPKGENVIIDPYLSNAVETSLGWKRLIPPIMAPNDLPPGLILFSHEHQDHCDTETVAALADAPYSYAGPPSCLRLLHETPGSKHFTPLRVGSTYTFGRIIVKAVEALHTQDAIGLVVLSEWGSIYHTGDTAASLFVVHLDPGELQTGSPEIAMENSPFLRTR